MLDLFFFLFFMNLTKICKILQMLDMFANKKKSEGFQILTKCQFNLKKKVFQKFQENIHYGNYRYLTIFYPN